MRSSDPGVAAASGTTMRAVRCTSLGDEPPSPLDIADIPVPAPGPGQVLIRVQACGLNVADELMRQGRYQLKLSLPFTPGQEVAGIIESVGPAVPDLSAGDPVVAIVDGGGLAQYALGDATSVLRRPPGLDAVSAAAVAVAYGTTDIALGRRAHLERGENLVIFGAGGMIGQCAVALGRQRGANVIAVASTQERAGRAVRAGASHGFASDRADLRELIYEATAGHGADVVLDSVERPGLRYRAADRCLQRAHPVRWLRQRDCPERAAQHPAGEEPQRVRGVLGRTSPGGTRRGACLACASPGPDCGRRTARSAHRVIPVVRRRAGIRSHEPVQRPESGCVTDLPTWHQQFRQLGSR